MLRVVHRVLTRFLLGQACLRASEACNGAVTPIQRFGSAANLNIHLHCLVLDGVYRRGESRAVFVEASTPTDEAVRSVLHETIVRTMRAFGPRAGRRLSTLMGAMPRTAPWQPLFADIDGFSVHAAVRVEAHERKRLEQLCRYVTRPALADERVQCNAAGQVELEIKTPWRDGTTHLVMSPLEFMQRLAALVPRRRLRAPWPTSRTAGRVESAGPGCSCGCSRSTSNTARTAAAN